MASTLAPPSLRNSNCSPLDLDLLRAVQQRPHTLVRYQRGVDHLWLVAQLALAWPTLSIAIGTSTRAEAIRAATALARHGVAAKLLGRYGTASLSDRVVVGTFTSLAECECEKRDIFVVSDARKALGERAATCLMQADSRWRLVGLIPADAKLSPWEGDWVTAAFGVVAVDIRRPGQQTALPYVGWLVHRHYHVTDASSAVAARDHLSDPIRIRQLSRLAKMIAGGEYAPSRSVEENRHGMPVKVVLFTNTLRQAEAFCRRLPGWTIATGCDPQTNWPGPDCAATWDPVKLIATPDGLSNAGVLLRDGLHVLIWVGGGAHLPPLPRAWMTRPYGSTRQVLVLDIADVGTSDLHRAARRRRRAYRRAEWLAPGADLHQHRIERFLADRPPRNNP